MLPCDSCFSSNEKSYKKYACALSKCEEKNATAIVSQKTDIEKVGRKSVGRSRKKQNVAQRKRCMYQAKIMLINSIESLATSRQQW